MQNGTSLFDNTSLSNYYIFNCYFEECKETGAIYIKRDNEIYALIEESVFNHSSSTSEDGGGSICFDIRGDGNFVQQRTCYYASIANFNMAFCQYINSLSNNKNYAIDISVFKCGENEEKGRNTLDIGFNDIRFENNNISNNKCQWLSSCSIVPNGSPGACNFSTFRENNQTESKSIGISTLAYVTQEFSYCNVIGNKCGTDKEQVLFTCQCTTNVDHCIFLNNIAKYMFEQYRVSYTLTISESYVESNSTTGPGPIKFNALKENNDFNNNFIHFYTENCFIDPKEVSLKLPYLSEFAKTASAGLFPTKK
ncbi:hypothetical protein TVAG_113000 [Trichomonas vaginalis G3]|uniref:Uncharacterized protein n=1 Tax=Trichomonas vaginalis (strain ATCC PRA-98 / G3) TaxID=412133 RepID=A2F747_TRIV3|nr:hypothetical protein TVAGG3_0258710 [Trichomonas vaginalis G3]EAX99284.1 hypothetical protein TVAG_113000 [Trichomonas vaginalis G3]KAI5524950.1 hypothetical protein TVAGG3_0258710 [Trichomonas vaginalis G3]|eukprot:XP_001312214.1 hypothetical protein [Trichomonas vaginalis G3]